MMYVTQLDYLRSCLQGSVGCAWQVIASHGDCWTASDVATNSRSTNSDRAECWDGHATLCSPVRLPDTSTHADDQLLDLESDSICLNPGTQARCLASVCGAHAVGCCNTFGALVMQHVFSVWSSHTHDTFLQSTFPTSIRSCKSM